MALSASKLKVGDTHTARLVEDLKRTQIVQYAGSSGDYNPLHTDEIFTTKIAGYPSVFAHGMLTMGMTGVMLTDHFGDGKLTKFGVRFTNQVWPGDTLVIDRIPSEDVFSGDIVLFGRDRRLFAHRVVTRGAVTKGKAQNAEILTRGDAMPAPDPPVPETQTAQKVIRWTEASHTLACGGTGNASSQAGVCASGNAPSPPCFDVRPSLPASL